MKRLAFSMVFLLLSAGLFAVPRVTEHFTDLTGHLGDLQPEIDKISADLENSNGSELAVLVVRDMEGLTIEDFSEQAFKNAGIGEKGLDNGALFVLSIGDRKARIETGYGLEGIMPDTMANFFLTEYGVPYFKNNQWREGVLAVTRQVAEHLARNYSNDGTVQPANEFVSRSSRMTESGTEDDYTAFIVLGLVLLAVMIFNGGLAGGHRFMRKYHLLPEIGIGLAALVLAGIFFPVSAGKLLYLIFLGLGGIVVFCIQYGMSVRHTCPKCRKYMEISSRVITPATHTSTGLRRISCYCPSCKHSAARNAVIPRLTRTYSSGGGGWRSGGGSSSGGGGHSFGGGSSGGGGASVSF